jgi:hypothetical protein
MKTMTELEQLKQENEQLKQIIREGKEIFVFVKDFLGLKDAANDNMLIVKISLMIGKLTRNPQVIKKLTDYIEKINAIKV